MSVDKKNMDRLCAECTKLKHAPAGTWLKRCKHGYVVPAVEPGKLELVSDNPDPQPRGVTISFGPEKKKPDPE